MAAYTCIGSHLFMKYVIQNLTMSMSDSLDHRHYLCLHLDSQEFESYHNQ